MKNQRKTTTQEQDVLCYLNELRSTGAINMFGAIPYIQEDFDLDKKESKRLLLLWMGNFNEGNNYETVKNN